MLTYQEFKAQWTPREEALRQSYGTDLKGGQFWNLAYRQYTRTIGLGTIKIMPELKNESALQN